jgi:hypothetical protein
MAGDSKLKEDAKRRFLRENPWCVFCGGDAPSTTIDHVPPISVFARRHRPKGLEFPACDPCNHNSRLTDQVAAYLSRLYPDASSEAEKTELRRILSGISNNHPGLLEEMLPNVDQLARFASRGAKMPPRTHALNANGPLLNAHMNRFAAKLGLALHYHHTGRIVPIGGAATVRWMTNFQALDVGIPKEFLNLLGPPETLRAGRFQVADQFQFAASVAQEKTASAHLGTFRFSFAIMAFVSESGASLAAATKDQIFMAGFLANSL